MGEPILVGGRTSIGRTSNQYEVVAPRRDTVVDEWLISLIYVRGSNIYVRRYLDLRIWPLRLRA